MTGNTFIDGIYSVVGNILGFSFQTVYAVGGSFVNSIFAFLPLSDGLPVPVINAANEVTPFFTTVNYFFPFSTVILLVITVFTIQTIFWGIQITLKVMYFIRGTDNSGSDNFHIVK